MRGLLILCALAACAQPPNYTLVVDGGEFDRGPAIASFEMPEAARVTYWQARGPDGIAAPIQLDASGTGVIILESLGARETRTLALEPAPQTRGVALEQAGGLLRFHVQGRLVVAYHAAKMPMPRGDIDSIYHRNGYLHPVVSPSGRMVTDDYAPNHMHHHGIWAAWTKTLFQGRAPDFWNMGSGTGAVEGVAVDEAWEGPVHGGLRARHRYIDLTGDHAVTALLEEWRLRVYNPPGALHHIFDVALTQESATESLLALPTYRYGGVGFRGHRDWDGEEGATFLTSQGKDRSNGHATRARWCHIGGVVDGEPVGIAILGHPDNYEAPQPMRIHPTEPFFNFAPSQAGDFAIAPGALYEARYRFVVYDGLPDAETLDRLWEDYAHPPRVWIQP